METPLRTLIVDTIRRSGPITFARYMELCLYHPEHGYYMQDRERTGIHGDYFTSSDLHPIFARLLARQATEMWELLDRPERFSWIEMGAGRGWFAHDFLRWVRSKRAEFAARLDYVAIETSAGTRRRLLDRLAELAERVTVAAHLDELSSVTGCFFSNELVDAFPVHVVTRIGGRLKEIYVTEEGNALRETAGPISESAVAAAVARYAPQLEEGHRVEVHLAAVRWLRSVAEKLAAGFVVTVDYGGLAERLSRGRHPRGTLLAYRGHRASEDLFCAPGEQDLTAHVNFSALIDTGREAGLELTGLTTQERFLMALGGENEFGDLYESGETETEKLAARLKLKRLIFPEGPGGMGQTFKVLIQHRGIPAPSLRGLERC